MQMFGAMNGQSERNNNCQWPFVVVSVLFKQHSLPGSAVVAGYV